MTLFYQLLGIFNHESWLQRIYYICNHGWWFQKRIFLELLIKSTFFLKNFPRIGFQNAIFMENEISLFTTVSHGFKDNNKKVLCNHDSWLQGIFFPSHPWLAKRQISWYFPIIFIKMSLLLKHVFTYDLGKKKSQFQSSFFKVDSQNPKLDLEYLINSMAYVHMKGYGIRLQGLFTYITEKCTFSFVFL